MIEINDKVGGLGSVGLRVQFQGIKVRRAIGFPSRLGLDRVAHHLLETSHCGRLEVNVAQDEAALCTELEGLYYAYSYDGGCLWPG